jgi:hypothetical protein
MDTSVSRRKVIGALAASAIPAASYTRIWARMTAFRLVCSASVIDRPAIATC